MVKIFPKQCSHRLITASVDVWWHFWEYESLNGHQSAGLTPLTRCQQEFIMDANRVLNDATHLHL